MIPVWSTACPDWAERLKKGLSIIPAPIYPDQAAHALAIFKQLRIVDAPGSPTFGESCAPWVFDLVAALFGILRCADRCTPYKGSVHSDTQKKQQVHAGCRDHDDGAVTELAAGGGLHHSGPDRGGGG